MFHEAVHRVDPEFRGIDSFLILLVLGLHALEQQGNDRIVQVKIEHSVLETNLPGLLGVTVDQAGLSHAIDVLDDDARLGNDVVVFQYQARNFSHRVDAAILFERFGIHQRDYMRLKFDAFLIKSKQSLL